MQECNNSKVLKENYSKLDIYANLNYLSSMEVEYIFKIFYEFIWTKLMTHQGATFQVVPE